MGKADLSDQLFYKYGKELNLSIFIQPLRFVLIIWVVFIVETFLSINFGGLGILPRTSTGLTGILTATLVHGSLNHIISNTFPVFSLGVLLYFCYPSIANRIFVQCYLLTNSMVWLLARGGSYHIGCSGLVYALAAFLIAIGIYKKDLKSLLTAIVVIVLYGGLVGGLFPLHPGVSWESHLLGAIAGVAFAWFEYKTKKVI